MKGFWKAEFLYSRIAKQAFEKYMAAKKRKDKSKSKQQQQQQQLQQTRKQNIS